MKKLLRILTALSLTAVFLMSVFAVNAVTFQSIPKNYAFHYGVDVSKWNGNLKWNKLRDSGVDFAFIRVGYYDNDGGHIDTKFKTNVKNCVENGIEFGVYVYSYVYKISEAKKCAKWVHKQIKSMGNYTKNKGIIPVAYDIEDSYQANALIRGKISKSYLQDSVQKFCDKTKGYGYIPVVYSYENFFKDYLYLDKFQKNNVRIWYARWPSAKELDITVKRKMFNKTNPDIWQFASTYTIDNVVLDTNVAYDDFYDYSKENSTLTINGLNNIYSYKKKGVQPAFTVYEGETKLKKGTDYKAFYFNNKSSGRARIKIVRFKNSKYIETKTFFFTILPPKVSGVKVTPSTDEINIKWNKVSGASYYQIFEYDTTDGEYNEIDTSYTNSYENFFLTEGTKYQLRVRAVLEIGDQIYYGEPTDFTAYTKYKKVSLISADSYKKGKVNLTWNSKTSDCLGYEVQYSTDSSFKSYKKLTVNSAETEELSINLKSKKTYYFRIRSYNNIDDKKVYSLYSRTLSTKIK